MRSWYLPTSTVTGGWLSPMPDGGSWPQRQDELLLWKLTLLNEENLS